MARSSKPLVRPRERAQVGSIPTRLRHSSTREIALYIIEIRKKLRKGHPHMIRDWVELNMTPGIGPRAAAKLLERFGSAEAVYNATRTELELLRLAPEAVDTIIARNLRSTAEAEIAAVRKLGSDILLLDDGIFPSSLREIYDPPIVLYVKGAWSECLDQPCIGVVGSRRCSTYGQNSALMLARDLAQRGVTVVSGFARGIDAAAHRGALEGSGRTVAVLGTG